MADPKLSAKVLSQINAIKDVLRQSALKGATLEEIQSTIKVEIPHRTLQRRLEYLRNAGAVTSSGDTLSTRYYLATSPIKVEETGTNGSVLPLSEEGQHILSLVYLPEQQRTPVGYNREFLELYQPNITNYLSVEKTDQLLRWGQTPGRNQTAGT